MFIKLNGKEYELKFTYRTIRYLENHYGVGISSLFEKLDMGSIDVLNTFLWAMLKREKDWLNKTVDDVADAIDNAIESEELSLVELGEKIGDAIRNSTILKSVDVNQGTKKVNGKKGKK